MENEKKLKWSKSEKGENKRKVESKGHTFYSERDRIKKNLTTRKGKAAKKKKDKKKKYMREKKKSK
jgi:hypothetical protein